MPKTKRLLSTVGLVILMSPISTFAFTVGGASPNNSGTSRPQPPSSNTSSGTSPSSNTTSNSGSSSSNSSSVTNRKIGSANSTSSNPSLNLSNLQRGASGSGVVSGVPYTTSSQNSFASSGQVANSEPPQVPNSELQVKPPVVVEKVVSPMGPDRVNLQEAKVDELETAQKESKPADLPPVESSDIQLPQVIANQKDDPKKNLLVGIIAWILILGGIALVLFVLISSRKTAHMERLGKASSKKSKKKLLPNQFYKD